MSLTKSGSASAGTIVVRPSTEADAPAMIAIYTAYVTTACKAWISSPTGRRTAFEPNRAGGPAFEPNRAGGPASEPMQAEDIKRRRKNMVKHRLPHLVAELDGQVIGYAYAVPFRKRPAYRYCVKHSIYVHENHLRAGVGASCCPLIEACAAAGYRQMIAYVDSKTPPRSPCTRLAASGASPISPASASASAAGPTSVMLQRARGRPPANRRPAMAPRQNSGRRRSAWNPIEADLLKPR